MEQKIPGLDVSDPRSARKAALVRVKSPKNIPRSYPCSNEQRHKDVDYGCHSLVR